MIRRSRHRICMLLVSVGTPGRSRSTFAICTPALRGAVTRLAERAPSLLPHVQALRFISLHLPVLVEWGGEGGDVQKTSVCIRSCLRGLAGDSQPPPGPPEASNGGYIKAKANLWVSHQTVNDNYPSTQSTQTQASWLRKRRILSTFLFPPL